MGWSACVCLTAYHHQFRIRIHCFALSTAQCPATAGRPALCCAEWVNTRTDALVCIVLLCILSLCKWAMILSFVRLSVVWHMLELVHMNANIRLLSLFGLCFITLMNNSIILITVRSLQHIFACHFQIVWDGMYVSYMRICSYQPRIHEHSYTSHRRLSKSSIHTCTIYIHLFSFDITENALFLISVWHLLPFYLWPSSVNRIGNALLTLICILLKLIVLQLYVCYIYLLLTQTEWERFYSDEIRATEELGWQNEKKNHFIQCGDRVFHMVNESASSYPQTQCPRGPISIVWKVPGDSQYYTPN